MSDSDDEYDPAEVVVPAPAPTTTTATAGSNVSAPLSKADLFPSSASASATTSGPSPAASATTGAAPRCGRSAELDNTEGGYRLRSDIKGRIRCIALNPAGTTLCAGSEDGQLCMWDFTVPLKSHRVAPTRVLTPFVNRISGLQPIIALTSAKDGSYFVACQDGDSPALVRASGEQLGYCAMGERGLLDVVQCRGHRAPVTCVAAHHSDATVFLTGSQDGTVRLWNRDTFKQRSTYAIKHGSGQVTDTHVVESVVTLTGFHGAQADVFASGGQDGVVQLWDSRVKYRPGGALASVDVLASAATAATSNTPADSRDPFADKHVGGFLEVMALAAASSSSSTATSSSDHGLAVRAGSSIKIIDLRRLSSSPAVASPSAVVHEAASGLSSVLDTTGLAGGSRSDPSSLLTCTSRTGYSGSAGGHVVQYAFRGSNALLDCTRVWRAGRREEDVLCVCADRSRTDGCLYAGLSSGEVVVHGAFSSGTNAQPLEIWLKSRPEREGRGRLPGEKAARTYDDDNDIMAALF